MVINCISKQYKNKFDIKGCHWRPQKYPQPVGNFIADTYINVFLEKSNWINHLNTHLVSIFSIFTFTINKVSRPLLRCSKYILIQICHNWLETHFVIILWVRRTATNTYFNIQKIIHIFLLCQYYLCPLL